MGVDLCMIIRNDFSQRGDISKTKLKLTETAGMLNRHFGVNGFNTYFEDEYNSF